MQLIAEAYWVMKNLIDLTNEEMADVFARWNEGKLRSYLIEITSNILRHKDKSGGYLIDKILDAAGQKGTGKWSVINAMELGMPLGLIATAVFERSLSAQKELRHLASKQFLCKHTLPVYNKAELVKEIFSALYASKLVSYAQGFAVLQRASDAFGWNLDLASIARMWRGGCIIRSIFLNDIAAAFEAADKPKHLLLAPYFREEIKSLLPGWKNLVAEAMKEELPVPAFSSALNYFYSLTSDNLPANLVQAQRDYFGAHTFERKSCADSSFMRIGRDTEGRRSRGLIMSEYFSFALMQKKGTKRKNQGCTYGATPAASPAKGQELAPLKQPALLHAGDTASA